MAERFRERHWESATRMARFVRAMLMPLSWTYGLVVSGRNRLYDAGVLRSRSLELPTVSIGNLTVGGTGKTPIASWFASRITHMGGRPAIILRGYGGGDEAEVHRLLNPRAVVVVGADRVRAAHAARAAGASVIVLDDAFQHRRAHRDADVVLVSADRHRQVRLLPAGPWREPVDSLRRATHIVVTRRGATPLQAQDVLDRTSRMAPHAVGAIVHLAAGAIACWGVDETSSLDVLAGRTILAVSGIGDPQAFEAQLRAASGHVVSRAFSDHHAYAKAHVHHLARDAEGVDFLICTLKDAVKIAPYWPTGGPPLWYLSQRVSVEHGAEALDELARRLTRFATT